MPFKSRAQCRKCAELPVKGEISIETWNRETGGKKLPERGVVMGLRRDEMRMRQQARQREGPQAIEPLMPYRNDE